MKTALLVIDYINGIIDGSCRDYAKSHDILAKTNKLIAGCRNQAIPIYFIRLAFDEDYSSIPQYSNLFKRIRENNLFKIGNKDTEFVPDLNIKADDIIVNKTATSPFHSENLLTLLENQGITSLIFSGVATDNAINIGVREAHDTGFYTIIAEDACGASSEQFHQWSITLLEKIANKIVLVDDIIDSDINSCFA